MTVRQVRRLECVHCPESEVHSTGSTLYVICPFQSGVRRLNDWCNLPEKEWLILSKNKK